MGAATLSAQRARMVITNDTVMVGDMEDIQVNVLAFGIQEAVSIEATISWDTSQLRYLESEGLEIPVTIGDAMVDSGFVTFIALDATLMGLAAADSTPIATLSFRRVADIAGTAAITFVGDTLQTNSITDTLVIDDMGAEFETLWVDGQVVFSPATSVAVHTEDERLSIYPNPISDASRLLIDLNYASPATLELLTTEGRLLHRLDLQITPGERVVRLDRSAFPVAGYYVLRLTTDREQFTRKIIRR